MKKEPKLVTYGKYAMMVVYFPILLSIFIYIGYKNISYIYLFAALVPTSATIAYLIDYYTSDGHILNFYRRFVERVLSKHPRMAWVLSPLGYCVYCTHHWVHLFSNIILFYVLGLSAEFTILNCFIYYFFFVFSLSISHLLLKFTKFYL